MVGVMPKRFMWRGADVYLPIVFERGRVIEGVRYVHLLGRLKRGVTEAQAEADLRPIIEDLRTRDPSQFPDKWRVGLLFDLVLDATECGVELEVVAREGRGDTA